MHEVLVNRFGGLSLPRKSVVRSTDHPDMTLDVYCGRITTKQQQLEKKVQVSHSQVPAGQVGIRGPLYPKNSIRKMEPIHLLSLPFPFLNCNRYQVTARLKEFSSC